MKVWYQAGNLKKRIGIITDQYLGYFELKDTETGEYVIKHLKDLEPIENFSSQRVSDKIG